MLCFMGLKIRQVKIVMDLFHNMLALVWMIFFGLAYSYIHIELKLLKLIQKCKMVCKLIIVLLFYVIYSKVMIGRTIFKKFQKKIKNN